MFLILKVAAAKANATATIISNQKAKLFDFGRTIFLMPKFDYGEKRYEKERFVDFV